ncbi:hypothetical protein ACSMXM_04925 [Pacificimonas sp. ICDLI1SI03]
MMKAADLELAYKARSIVKWSHWLLFGSIALLVFGLMFLDDDALLGVLLLQMTGALFGLSILTNLAGRIRDAILFPELERKRLFYDGGNPVRKTSQNSEPSLEKAEQPR